METAASEPTGAVDTAETQTGETHEYVDVEQASDEDLGAFMENAEKAAFGQPDNESIQTEPETTEKPEQQPAAEDGKGEYITRADFEKILQTIAKQDKQLQGQELLIKRRTSELGEVKNQLSRFIAEKSEGLRDRAIEDPIAAMDDNLAIREARKELDRVHQEEQLLTHIEQTRQLSGRFLGEGGFDTEMAAEALREDGMPEQFIQVFVQNPEAAVLPETFIQLGKRAQDRRKMVQYEQALAQLVPFAQKLMAERSRGPEEVLTKVDRALRSSPSLTGRSGSSAASDGFRNGDPSSWNDEELNAFMNRR